MSNHANNASRRRPTLMDVARVAGVSHMTVSRVVRGTHNVSAATVKRVETAIRDLDYKPDPTMSALAAYRMQGRHSKGGVNLAFLDRDESQYSALVFEGLNEEARLHGYSVERFVISPSKKEQLQLNRMLIARGVRGLLFGPSDAEWSLTDWSWDEFAMVSLGALSHRPSMHSVCMHYFEGAFSACRMALERGGRRIGFAVEPRLQHRTGHQWMGGYAAAVGPGQTFVFDGDWPEAQSFSKWCLDNRIDAVLSVHPQLLDSWPGKAKDFYLLNDSRLDPEGGTHRYYLDPKQIGSEGVRFLYHLLLRREYGLPDKAKITVLKGAWTVS